MFNNYDDLFEFNPPLTKKHDFKRFWEETLKEAKNKELNLSYKQIDYPSEFCTVFEVSYHGFDATPIFGYLIKPTFIKESLPVLIHYHGFMGNGGEPSDFMHYVMMGLAVFTFDIRGQLGRTGNFLPTSNGTNNIVTNGILNPYEYYYRAVYVDSIKAIDVVCQFDFIDPSQIIIEGGSQGGGLVMAVAALDQRPKLALCDVPSYSYYEGRFKTATGSVGHIVQYVKSFPQAYQQVMDTLSYFDTMNMADQIKSKVLASVGMKDQVCPAKFYFATYNRITAFKEIKISDLGGHDGGGKNHLLTKMNFIKTHLKK